MPKVNELPVNNEIPDRARELEDECRSFVHTRTNGGDQSLHIYRFLFEKIAELQIIIERGNKK